LIQAKGNNDHFYFVTEENKLTKIYKYLFAT